MNKAELIDKVAAAAELNKAGKKCKPEIMVPVTCDASEIKNQKAIIAAVYAEVCKKTGVRQIMMLPTCSAGTRGG